MGIVVGDETEAQLAEALDNLLFPNRIAAGIS